MDSLSDSDIIVITSLSLLFIFAMIVLVFLFIRAIQKKKINIFHKLYCFISDNSSHFIIAIVLLILGYGLCSSLYIIKNSDTPFWMMLLSFIFIVCDLGYLIYLSASKTELNDKLHRYENSKGTAYNKIVEALESQNRYSNSTNDEKEKIIANAKAEAYKDALYHINKINDSVKPFG